MRSRPVSMMAIVGIILAAGFATPAEAKPTVVSACDNAAWKPYWTPGGGTAQGLINGEVRRQGTDCGNADVQAIVYVETGWFDEVAAYHFRHFAVGTLQASGRCWQGRHEYYTKIRVNGSTIAKSDPVEIRC